MSTFHLTVRLAAFLLVVTIFAQCANATKHQSHRVAPALKKQPAPPVYSLGSVSIAPFPQQFYNPGGNRTRTSHRPLRYSSASVPLRLFCRT